MPRPPESFKHSETAYNRPNQGYVCGHECQGKSCALGPGSKGACRAGFVTEDGREAGECIPAKGQYNRFTGETNNRERWYCGRDPTRGGPCEDGPRPDGSCCMQLAPCSPAASLRRRRGRAAFLLAALSFAFVLLLFAKLPDSLDHPLNPGHLSAAHSTAGMTCASCHDSADTPQGMLVDFHSDRAFLDAHRCIDCHHEIGGEDNSEMFNAHTLPQGHLAELTEKARERSTRSGSLMLAIASGLATDADQIACASCHTEHQGTGFDLKQLSNSQCQVCHTEQFDRLSHGHPEFTSYPYRRRTRIFFDHATHFREYFETEQFKQYAKQACTDCHAEQPDGGMMHTRSFADTCADCHDSNTRFGSWEILSFPKVDRRRLEDQLGAEVLAKLDAFPTASAREISPLLRVILEREELPTLYPLRKASDEEKASAAELTRSLLDGVFANDGEKGLSKALGASPLLADASPENARRLRQLGEILASLKGGAADEVVESKTDFGGTFSYDPGAGAFAYAPGGHADPVMKAVLDVAASKIGKLGHARKLFGAASDFWQGFDTTGAGKCLKCHTLDEGDDGTMMINWSPASADPDSRPITKFRHSSHVRLPEMVREDDMKVNASCASCHQLETSPDQIAAYRGVFAAENQNPFRFRSGFQELMRSNCAECHTENRAGDSCLQCHQYHATPSPLTPAIVNLIANQGSPSNGASTEAGEQLATGPDVGEGDLLVPETSDENESDLLVPDPGDVGDGDLLVPDAGDEGDGDLLVPDAGDEGDGDLLVPDAGGDGVEGESLIPDDSGESLIPSADPPADSGSEEEGGDSLLPSEATEEAGESLVPESESLLPPEDE